jgi:hypothetical protein
MFLRSLQKDFLKAETVRRRNAGVPGRSALDLLGW